MSNADNAPGVHIQESAPVAQPIRVGPTLIGILGKANRGKLSSELVGGWGDFVRKYGGFSTEVDLGVYARQGFDNGAQAFRVRRVVADDAVASSNDTDFLSHIGDVNMVVTAANPGSWGDELAVKFALHEVLSTGVQVYADSDTNDLPNNGANGNSNDSVSIPVDSITRVQVGDVVDVFDTDGVWLNSSPLLVQGLDADTKSIIAAYDGVLDVTGAGFYLRTGSQHRLKTFAKEAIVTASTANVDLDSVRGISRGSVLSFSIFSHCKTIEARGILGRATAVVSRVSGTRAYFTAAVTTSTGQTLPATTSAALRFVVAGNESIDVVANDAGPGGNKISLKVVTGAGANSISVNGKTITVNSLNYTTLTAKNAINASAAASALVTATANNNADTVVPAMPATRLTGGAQLLCFSQEFGLQIYLGESLAKSHSFLSMLSTSPDYIGIRLGGDPDTYTPVSGSESDLIIVSGLDAAVDDADDEFYYQPRALPSVGLAGGDDGGVPTDDDYIAAATELLGNRDIKLAIAPGVTSPDAQVAFANLARDSQHCQFLLDSPSDVASAQDVLDHRSNDLGLDEARAQLSSSWVYIQDPRPAARAGAELLVPFSPAWAGLIAQVQKDLGSNASPGTLIPVGARRLSFAPSQDDAGLLNDNGVCCLRVVSGGIHLMGDRTLMQAVDPRRFGPSQRYLNQWILDVEDAFMDPRARVLFGPNNEDTYAKVEKIIREICVRGHGLGALFPKEDITRAFTVTCNLETTDDDMRLDGEVGAEVELSLSTMLEKLRLKLAVGTNGVRVVSAS